VIAGYISLMKLRVVELLLVTTVPALFLAADGMPKLSITLATLIGGTLAAGSANTFNMVIESDSDKLMARTSSRPIVTGQISKRSALIFASLIGLASLLIFSIFTTYLAAGLTLFAIAFYVLGTQSCLRKIPHKILFGAGSLVVCQF
jgi:heme o synthase